MQTNLKKLIDELNQGLIERENITKIALLTLLAGENIVMVGPPGTGKSLVARRIAECFGYESDNNANYFEYLLTKFSTPEEIFGPLSINELKQDKFRRNTAGYLPSVKVAFLDEIFKANSSILNALLTILNERIYHNGSEKVEVPLQGLIAASNELPTEQEELSALYDRFLIRSFVGYVSENNLADLLIAEPVTHTFISKFSAAELVDIKTKAKTITLPEKMVKAILKIREEHHKEFKEDSRETISDRRLKKALGLLKVSAATNQRTEIDLSDLFLLQHLLWNHPENRYKVRDLVSNVLNTFSCPVPINEAGEEVAAFAKAVSPPERAKLNNLISGFQGRGTADDPLLIQNIEELMDVLRPEIGQQGYYFRQTADLDLSAITDSAWPAIYFKGHFNGNGYEIKRASLAVLFKCIEENSSVSNLKLENIQLASTAKKSTIANCSTSDVLLTNARNCIVSACVSGSYLIKEHSRESTIKYCQAGSSLIRLGATHCEISDCLVLGNWSEVGKQGGIAGTLNVGNIIERCFVAGKLSYSGNSFLKFSGITSNCTESTIRCCAIGPIYNTKTSDNQLYRLTETNNSSTLENNACIDSNQARNAIENNRDGNDGATVAAAIFKQRYFEQTLGWDFENVWQWDDTNNHPVLCHEKVITRYGQGNASQSGSIDMLTQQIKANIWLNS